MQTKINMTVLLIPLLTILFAFPIGIVVAPETPCVEDDVQDAATVNETALSRDEIEEQIDKIGFVVFELEVQNKQLEKFSSNEYVRDVIEVNNATINRLMAKLDELSPPIPVVEVSAEEEKKMQNVMLRLAQSGLPILGMGINPSTGMLGVEVNAENKTMPHIEHSIRQIAHDVQVGEITYVTDDAVLQSSCSQTTGYCDPLIGGSSGEDENLGLSCTVSLAFGNQA